MRFFETMRQKLAKEHPGKWALVMAPDKIDIFDTQEAAYLAGIEYYGIKGGFVIEQCLAQKPYQYVPTLWKVDPSG